MFPELHAALKLDQRSITEKRINIVEEECGCGTFLLHHFISQGSKNGNLILVGLDQTLGHYHGVGLKLGSDLLKLQKSGRFVFIDLLKEVQSNYLKEEKFFLKSTLDLIKTKAEEMQKPMVIFDKLSLLLSLGYGVSDVQKFLQFIQIIVGDAGGTLVTVFNGYSSRDLEKRYGGEVELDYEDDAIVAFLDHTSHLTIVSWPLLTGHSEDVAGNFMFGWVDGESGRYQYNIEEKSVNVFALGASSAVL